MNSAAKAATAHQHGLADIGRIKSWTCALNPRFLSYTASYAGAHTRSR
jgi:hypothetical protein